ncbi:PAS domain S-box protein [uncultured Tolumonas sp.]|uniref:PAS domain S-box protein n=1 Tax=uncultured Tolumonas sp. TaxID=263765 RepID=UPI0029306CF7|nr:PAS domain S-box protein [uncultured Tolumonas sp.]
MKANLYPKTLKFRVIGIATLAIIFSFWILTISITKFLEQDISALLESQQFSTASYIAADINAKVVQRIELLSQNAKLISQDFDSPEKMREFLKGRLGLLTLFPSGLVVIDKQGVGIAEFPSQSGREKAFFDDREYFQAALSTGQTVIGKPRISRFNHQPLVGIATPIKNTAGELIGVLAGFVPFSDKSLFGQVERSIIGKTGTIIVSDPRYRLIVSSSKPADILQPITSSIASFAPVFAGMDGSKLSATSNGIKALVSTKMIPSAGWAVQVILPVEEAFMPIQHIKTIAYSIAFSLTLLSVGLIGFLVKRSLIPLEKLSTTIRQMATQESTMSPLPVIGTAEVRELAESFNTLTERRARSDKLLRQSEERLSRAELASKSGNWELNLDTQTIFASVGAMKIYGLNQEHISFAEIKKTALPEYRTLLDTAMRALIEHGIPYNVEFRIRTIDTGEFKDIHSLGSVDRENNTIFGVIQDVSERLSIQKALKKEEARRRIFLEQSQEGMAVLRQDGNLEEWNPAFTKMLGYPNEEIRYLNVRDWDINLKSEEIAQITQGLGLGHLTIETRHQRKDGTRYDVEVSISGVEWAGQYYLFCLHRDISNRKQAEIALKQSEERFRLVIDASPIPYALNDDHFNITYLNSAFIRTFGYTLEDIPTLADWWPKAYPDPEYRQQLISAWQEHMVTMEQTKQLFIPVEAEIHCKNGDTRTALVAAEPLTDSFHDLHVISFFDITERKQAEESQRLAATVFSHAREGILIIQANRTILNVNRMFSEITGYNREEVLGGNLRMFNTPKHTPMFYARIWRDIKINGYWNGEIWSRRKNGELFPAMLTISAVNDFKGNVQQYVALFADISEAKEYKRRLEEMVNYDPLTRLPNRLLLSDRLQQAMVQTIRRKRHIAVCYLDLDGFKQVNDSYGHAIGDRLLVTLAGMMKQTLRESDTLARIGGDEFVAVLLDVVDETSFLDSAQRLIQVVAQPIYLGELEVHVSASLGITFYPQDESIAADQLLRQADSAMYQAKLSGKNRYCVFAKNTSLV